jgi:hypothetical protein
VEDATDAVLSSNAELHSGGDLCYTLTGSKSNKEWYINVTCNNTKLKIKVDTGASCNVMPFHVFNSLVDKPTLKKHSAKLLSYSGHDMPVLRKVSLLVEWSKNFRCMNLL